MNEKATFSFLLTLYIFLALWFFFMKHPDQKFKLLSQSSLFPANVLNISGEPEPLFATKFLVMSFDLYSMIQNLQLMVFMGFGFFMTSLKKYGRSSLSFSFVLSSFVFIWYIIIDGVINMKKKIYISLWSLVRANLAVVNFLVSLGAVLGKFNILQLYMMAFIETPVYAALKYLVDDVIMASDFNGSLTVYLCGALFGYGVSLMHRIRFGPRDNKTDLEKSSYDSDISSMLGILFLWVSWPNFNGILTVDGAKTRAVANTYLALVSSGNLTSAIAIWNSRKTEGKLDLSFIKHMVLGTGVTIGAVSCLEVSVQEAVLIGTAATAFSYVNYRYLQDFLTKRTRSHDTCGVLHLYGFPGFLGCMVAIIYVSFATKKIYENDLGAFYPAMKKNGKNRSRPIQMGYQLLALIVASGISLTGGLITGGLLSLTPKLTEEEYYTDERE